MKTQILNKRKRLILVLLVSAVTTGCASHDAQQNSRQGGPKGRAPLEAVEACKNLSEDAVCSFSGREGETLEGICIALPDSEALACAPEGGAMPMPRR